MTISCGFNPISNSWLNPRWQPRWRPFLATSKASSSATTRIIYLILRLSTQDKIVSKYWNISKTLGSEKSSAGMEFLRSFLRNSTILQITSKKTSHAHHKLILTSLRFHARYKFLFPQRSSIGETRSDHVTRNASPRDKANWNLRVKTAALETILEVVEF